MSSDKNASMLLKVYWNIKFSAYSSVYQFI
jgi:hypothetical protein